MNADLSRRSWLAGVAGGLAMTATTAEARPDEGFNLRRFLRPYRRPLSFGFALVVVDALLTLAGPLLVREGLLKGVQEGSERALWIASAAFFVVTILDWLDKPHH